MGNPVLTFDIAGSDAKELSEFYSKVFDWEMKEYDEGYYGVETGSETNRGIEGLFYPPNEEMNLVDNVPFGNNVSIYVTVEDIDVIMNKLENLGGRMLMPPAVVSEKGEKIGMFIDPSGNRIGLYQK